MDERTRSYRERPLPSGAVLWQRATRGDVGEVTLILPDGCLDLLWDGSRLVIAGPDSTARRHTSAPAISYTAVRFSRGLGPALFGVPAHELRDRTVPLHALWPDARARELTERVASDPSAALARWVSTHPGTSAPDPFGSRVLDLAARGASVATIADRLGVSVRQLHRRCLLAFGYGPRRLARILRFGSALDQLRAGVPSARVAAECGYADQAHFSREVRELADATPRSLLAELRIGPAGPDPTRHQVEGAAANRSTGVPSGSRATA